MLRKIMTIAAVLVLLTLLAAPLVMAQQEQFVQMGTGQQEVTTSGISGDPETAPRPPVNGQCPPGFTLIPSVGTCNYGFSEPAASALGLPGTTGAGMMQYSPTPVDQNGNVGPVPPPAPSVPTCFLTEGHEECTGA